MDAAPIMPVDAMLHTLTLFVLAHYARALAWIMISGMVLVIIMALTSRSEVDTERNPGDW